MTSMTQLLLLCGCLCHTANTDDLPRHFRSGTAAGNLEPAASDLLCHVQSRTGRTDRGELITELAIRFVQGERQF